MANFAQNTTTRQVAVWESAADLIALYTNEFNFQFAKSVIGKNGQRTYNVVWQSLALAPRFGISWEPVYGLNWTLKIPTGGLTVTLGGDWQTCALGQSYDLSVVGLWTESQPDPNNPPKQDFMNVGKNNYKYPGQTGIHIVIGVKNADNGFDTIYVDPTQLGVNMGAWYQPQEEVKWWYQTGVRSSTMIAGADTPIQTYNMSAPNPATGLFYISTTYVYDTGKWINSPTAPKAVAETGVLGSQGSGSMPDGAPSGNAPLAPYQGTIIWPNGTSQADMQTGGDEAADNLRAAGYSAAVWIDLFNYESHVDFFAVGSLPPPGVPMSVTVAWEDAFAAVTVNGAQDGGVADMSAQFGDSDQAPNGAGATQVNGNQMNSLQLRKGKARAVAGIGA